MRCAGSLSWKARIVLQVTKPGGDTPRRLADKWPHVYRLTRPWQIVLLILAPALAIGGSIAAIHWPYRYREIHPLLVDVFGNQVRIEHYHRIYFPHPGFVATDLTLSRGNMAAGPALGSVQTLMVEGRWKDLLLLRRRIRLVEVSGLHVVLNAPGAAAGSLKTGSAGGSLAGPTTPIEEMQIHNAVLDILHNNGSRLTFAIRELVIDGLQRGRPMSYKVDLENAIPSGHIAATGDIGPLNPKDPGSIPVSGRFTFNQVKMSDVGDLHGILASTGYFSGPLSNIRADAISDTPDFAVDDGAPTDVRGAIRCRVNALNGDVFLDWVKASTGRTTVTARGQIAGSPKTAQIGFALEQGRAEDVLRPFMQESVPILGPVTLHGEAEIGPTGKPFLERLRVDGHFDAPAEQLTNRQTEKTLSAFSHRMQNGQSNGAAAQKDPDGEVFSSLSGPAIIRNGVVSTPGVLFRVAGAHVRLRGTFQFEDEAVYLTGTLKMDAPVSKATTGWKSIVLKPLDPFFHRKHRKGSKIPIAVTGSPGHYKVTQDIAHSK